MLKLSRFFVVTAMFFLTLFIFLTFNPDSYDVAPVDNGAVLFEREAQSGSDAQAGQEGSGLIAVITGAEANEAVVTNITRALSLLKRPAARYETVAAALAPEGARPRTMIVAARVLSDEELTRMKAYLAKGGSVIFAALPAMSDSLRDILGIVSYASIQHVRGIDIYEGVLLGGMFRSDKLVYRCADIELSWRCKVLANGYDIREYEEEVPTYLMDKTPMMWRTYYDGGMIVAFNGPFMEKDSGMGLLTGALATVQEDFLYPAVGSKSVVLDAFPYFSDTDIVAGRAPLVFTRDIIWPGMLSVARSAGITYTCYPNDNYAANGDANAIWTLMVRELQKIRGELGYTLEDEVIAQEDLALLREWVPNIIIRSLRESASQTQITPDATSIMMGDWDGAMAWASPSVITLPVVSEGLHSDAETLRMMSGMSLAGMVIHRVDMEPLYKGDVLWNDFSIELATYMAATVAEQSHLESKTIGFTAEAVKDYLNTSLSMTQDETAIHATIDGNADTVQYILRTARKVDIGRLENCTVEETEKGVYWVKSPGPTFAIYFEDETEAMP